MSQRSYSNDRNRKGAKVGSTRKSAAKAKPVRQQGAVEVAKSAEKTRKKPGVQKDWSGLPTSPEIDKWRRVWWVLLLTGVALVALGYLVPELRSNTDAQRVITGIVIVASMSAVLIDLVVIRKLRTQLIASTAKKPSKKEAAHQSAEAPNAKSSSREKKDAS